MEGCKSCLVSVSGGGGCTQASRETPDLGGARQGGWVKEKGDADGAGVAALRGSGGSADGLCCS